MRINRQTTGEENRVTDIGMCNECFSSMPVTAMLQLYNAANPQV